MISISDLDRLQGGNVVSTDGSKIGGIGQFYLEDDQPTFVTTKTGLFGLSESLVPLHEAQVQGDDIVVPYDKNKVKDAPRVEVDGSDLTDEVEEHLYSYYSVSRGSSYDTAGTGAGAGLGDRDNDRDFSGDRDTVGHDTSGPTTDDAMTRSEEQLHVGTERREAGRARLKKYVVTENVTQTVPVSHEEVRIEREPITDANRGDAHGGPAISEEEHEVVLHEERPVVEKEAVPVERVRLDKETVTEQETVSEEVRKEQIDTDLDGDGRGGRDDRSEFGDRDGNDDRGGLGGRI